MSRVFPWKRFWCRREDSYSLGDRGFLFDPEGEHGALLNPHLVAFNELQAIPCLALLGEPGIGKSWSLSLDLDAFLQQSPELATMRLDLRGYGREDRLYRALFEDGRFLQWVEGDHDLHLYLDSFDECLLRIDNVAALLADDLPQRPLKRLKLRIACRTASWPPIVEDAMTLIGPTDTIRFLRDGTLERLKQRGTFEACDALAQTELRFPQYRWLSYDFDLAETLACAVTWEPPVPKDILAMAGDSNKRFVECGGQLLGVVLESLNRLQRELHGDLAAVGDLWNSQGGTGGRSRRKDISDYIARFLRRDLVDRGIVINREVQVRRGRRGEMPGQSTDIHVDATPHEGSRTDRYGTMGLIIEVKGGWNEGLMTDMEHQLRDRYLKNNNCRIGIYAVAHFSAERWIASDDRGAKSRARNIDDLRTRLGEQARELSGSVLIRSFVLDASLDSTKASGIEESGHEEIQTQ